MDGYWGLQMCYIKSKGMSIASLDPRKVACKNRGSKSKDKKDTWLLWQNNRQTNINTNLINFSIVLFFYLSTRLVYYKTTNNKPISNLVSGNGFSKMFPSVLIESIYRVFRKNCVFHNSLQPLHHATGATNT